MLLNNFYSIIRQEPGEGSLKVTITFNRSHKIFEGHFPGHPVVPGVCMMQIVREVMEAHTLRKLKITTGDNLKFLSIINPDEHREVEVSITYSGNEDQFNINATLLAAPVTFFKFKGTLEGI